MNPARNWRILTVQFICRGGYAIMADGYWLAIIMSCLLGPIIITNRRECVLKIYWWALTRRELGLGVCCECGDNQLCCWHSLGSFGSRTNVRTSFVHRFIWFYTVTVASTPIDILMLWKWNLSLAGGAHTHTQTSSHNVCLNQHIFPEILAIHLFWRAGDTWKMYACRMGMVHIRLCLQTSNK